MITLTCPTGTKVVGGGGFCPSSDIRFIGSAPTSDTVWSVRVDNLSFTSSKDVDVHAVCLTVAR